MPKYGYGRHDNPTFVPLIMSKFRRFRQCHDCLIAGGRRNYGKGFFVDCTQKASAPGGHGNKPVKWRVKLVKILRSRSDNEILICCVIPRCSKLLSYLPMVDVWSLQIFVFTVCNNKTFRRCRQTTCKYGGKMGSTRTNQRQKVNRYNVPFVVINPLASTMVFLLARDVKVSLNAAYAGI